MRSTIPTPNIVNMYQAAGPSSPPETPNLPTSTFQNKRQPMNFSRPLPMPGSNPLGHGIQSSFDLGDRPREFSPISRTSTPSSEASITSRSSCSELAKPFSESPPSPRIRRRIVAEANFTVVEVRESDAENIGNEDEDKVIRPYQYEDAESDRGTRAKQLGDFDPNIVSGMNSMVFDEDAERDVWVQIRREEKKAKRRTSSLVQKRKISESVGSSDEEDLQPVQLSANEVGSSARRLRRKVGDRTSLIFDDPPPGIPELEEPESCEEVVDDDGSDLQGLDRHLPFYVQVMDTDSGDE